MAINLIINVKQALEGMPVTQLHGWLDSLVVLHWLKGGGQYKQFVANRVSKVQSHPEVSWHHVPTEENPADLGSRGGQVKDCKPWWSGPAWLSNKEAWPPDIVTRASPETQAEAKATKELFARAEATNYPLDDILAKFTLTKAMRVSAWVSRFARNIRLPKEERISGPLTIQEIHDQHTAWTKRAQANHETRKDEECVGLQVNDQGLLECRGRLQGHYPIYLPDQHPYTLKLVEDAHQRTLHGGVGLTMARVRQNHWIPRLRRLAKRVIKQCYGCRRFQARAIAKPPPGNLPLDRTEGDRPFQAVGVDFAGPIMYRVSKKTQGKAYVILYACSLTRAIYLELTKSMETGEFLQSLKRLIARKGRPEKIYSDNARPFVAAAQWLKKVQQDEKFHHFLTNQNIKWQFNLSRAPWWGGQFERLVGLVKQALYKAIGNGCLGWTELQDVLLDVEVTLNNRPLGYLEDDIEVPVLTPNSIQFVGSTHLPELEPHREDDRDLRERAKYPRRCKETMWNRWTKEYLRGLRERHNLKHSRKPCPLGVGDVVVIQSEERNRGKWSLGVIEELYPGRDGITRAAKLRAGKSYLERAVNHLYPLELSCDTSQTYIPERKQLNPVAPEFRPVRNAAAAAKLRIKDIAQEQDEH